ncbi:alpha/beta hydrolase-fold protein [uncultured Rothia sp.]|uniref:alpha/beta hydrolase n=1 Tax=uncultured Rothia sp. TaxID=316088 RepID=UPI003216921E
MTEGHIQEFQLDFDAIEEGKFVPPPPIRDDESGKRLHTFLAAPFQKDGGFFVESSDHPGLQAMTVFFPQKTPSEKIVVVIDTLTHMNKTDLTPFTLSTLHLQNQHFHYGRFLLETDIRATIGFIRTTYQELSSLSTRREWKDFFSRTQPLRPLQMSIEDRSKCLATRQVLEPSSSLSFNIIGSNLLPQQTLLPGLNAFDKVQIWLYQPAQVDTLLIVCDGQTYVEEYPLWPVLDSAMTKHSPTSSTALMLIEPTASLTRNHFLGDQNYLADWLVSIGLPWARTKFEIPPAERCIIAGGSLGGLAASQVVRKIPRSISKAIVQSGAFWWFDGAKGEQEGQILQNWLTDPFPSGIEIFHEVGKYEGYLMSWNLAFEEILSAQNVNHTSRIYCGGHDYACWRHGIIEALSALDNL